MVTIPNQSSVPKAWQEFDESGRMKPSPYYDRVVDVMEELFKFTLMLRDRSDYLVSRYSERKGASQAKAASNAAGVVETPVAIGATAVAAVKDVPKIADACCGRVGDWPMLSRVGKGRIQTADYAALCQ